MAIHPVFNSLPLPDPYQSESEQIQKSLDIWVADSLLPESALNFLKKINGGEKLTDYYANRVFNQAENLVKEIIQQTGNKEINDRQAISQNIRASSQSVAGYLTFTAVSQFKPEGEE